jgi:hypothetical protein
MPQMAIDHVPLNPSLDSDRAIAFAFEQYSGIYIFSPLSLQHLKWISIFQTCYV